MSAARLFNRYLAKACTQFMGGNLKILFDKITGSEIESFNAELGMLRDNRQKESVPIARRKFRFLF